MLYEVITGHVGGDDFIVLFRSRDWYEICTRILADFEAQRVELYKTQHFEAGGFRSRDATGTERFQPLLSIAVGVVYPDPYKCTSHHEVAELALEASRGAKRCDGNAIFENPERFLRQPWREQAPPR